MTGQTGRSVELRETLMAVIESMECGDHDVSHGRFCIVNQFGLVEGLIEAINGMWPDHYVIFTADRWTVEHSLACRLSGAMSACDYHKAVALAASGGIETIDLGRWRITGVDSEGLPSLERAPHTGRAR